MNIKVDPITFQAIEAAGYGISGDIGGLRRTAYYTPDGRVIKAIPNMRDYVLKNKDGKVIDSGTRDGNLDRGWLLQMPQIKKLFCPSCDRWHDTQAEVKACKVTQDRMIAKMAAKTKREETDKTVDLEQQVAELKAMVEKLLEAQGGKLFQPSDNERPEDATAAGIPA